MRHRVDPPAGAPSPARRRPRRGGWARPALAALCAVALAWPSALPLAQVRLPSMGDSASDDVPPAAERRYGDQVMREVWRDPAYLDDAVLQAYLESLWAPLMRAALARGEIDDDIRQAFAWRVFLVRDRSVNAFALPGGWVGVHLGLIAMTQTEHELASVLAHELSHVSQRHIARSVAQSGRQSMVSMAAMLLGVLAASRSGNADMAQAAIVGGQAAMIQGQLNYSREMEREADRIGYGIFRDAGFDSAGMAAMFDKLGQANRLNDSGGFPYLRSHPLTTERQAEAQSRLHEQDAAGAATMPRPPSLAHQLMQARARVLVDGSDRALRHHLEAVTSPDAPTPGAGAWYAAALAAARLNDTSAVARSLARLREAIGPTAPPQARQMVELLAAELALAGGEPLRALAQVPAGPGRAELRWRAEAMLAAPPGAPGVDLAALDQQLRGWLAVNADDATVWLLQARAAEARGRPLQALRAHAEARAAQGDLNAAIDRLRAAQRRSRGADGAELIEASVIDARLRELLAQRRALYGDRADANPNPRN